MDPKVAIIIPSYNRAHSISVAVEAALEQSYTHKMVVVVDDGSLDNTANILERFFDRPNFQYLQLEENQGTANAKNVGLLYTEADAYTFHDSDDIPHRDKLLRQSRVLFDPTYKAADCLNWGALDKSADDALEVDGVLTHHELILPDGQRAEIRKTISLVDDFFPNLQIGRSVPGDWTHINSGLFRRSVFERWGGFANGIEEDREFRNRLIMAGAILSILPEILMTKIETPDSLTQSAETDYHSASRKADRAELWDKIRSWKHEAIAVPEPVHIVNPAMKFVSNANLLCLGSVIQSEPTSVKVRQQISKLRHPDQTEAA